MENYKVFGRVGQGAHGYVMKGVNRSNGKEVALKKLIIKNLDEGIPKNIMREIAALRVLKSEYIVELIDVIPHGMALILVMEYLPMSLYDVLRDIDNPINDSQIKTYMKMLLIGVKYMHQNYIMHRDLKPANLLIGADGILKIADLGLAGIYLNNNDNRQYSHQVATRWYRAPELLYGSRNYTNAVDLWAVGCIMAEMINKSPLFPGETDIEQLAIVLHTLGTPNEENWPGLTQLPDYNKITFAPSNGIDWNVILPNSDSKTIDLVKCFVQYDQSKRISASSALIHQYFFAKPYASCLELMPKEKSFNITIPDFDEIIKECESVTVTMPDIKNN